MLLYEERTHIIRFVFFRFAPSVDFLWWTKPSFHKILFKFKWNKTMEKYQ